MHKIRSYTVLPSLPESLKSLKTIAMNLFWTWNSEFVDIFHHVDPELWEKHGHNPIKLLGSISQTRLNALAENEGFLYQLRQAEEKLNVYLNSPGWFNKQIKDGQNPLVAYFSFEFGLHETLPIYSGGLGILAGDHLKSASDLNLPLAGIGLMYQKGYFRQYLNADGWQQERYTDNDFYNMPLEIVRKRSGNPLTISVGYPGRRVLSQIWKVAVGRITLYLLDTNIAANSPEDRAITASLYGGDSEMRIQQEILLGIGGFKALLAMGLEPTVCHMNEGHAAFMALERIRHIRNTLNVSFDEALEATRVSNVFTIHTPVKAGNDEFNLSQMDKYFSTYFPALGINRKQFLGLGRIDPNNESENFKMPVLAIRLSDHRNGVSKLHGKVSRGMWSEIWPGLPVDEVPITSITNGVHAKTFVSAELNRLYERYLGFAWAENITDEEMWNDIDQVPDEELWRIHQRNKESLITFARRRLRAQLERRGSFHTELGQAEQVLDPEALTIGFARRFATYKRGNLLLREPERLAKMLSHNERPLQIIFAGKAHPRDAEGKEIIRQIIHFVSKYDVRRRLVFLEDYDIDVARYLVQGVDVWLNNPRVPMEASGTSGMKAALNGVINLSTLDGWWVEGYKPDGGWVIGAGETYDDMNYQDSVESQSLFNLLENEVIPLFYTRATDKLPRAWIRRMKNTLKWCAPRFNTYRMVREYTERFYLPADLKWRYLQQENLSRVRALSGWKQNLRQNWSGIKIRDVDVRVEQGNVLAPLDTKHPELEVGANLRITAEVELGKVDPGDVAVQIYHGFIDSWRNINGAKTVQMAYKQKAAVEGAHIFEATLPCESSGQCGFALRIMPQNQDMTDPYEPGMIIWESTNGQAT